MLLFGFADLVYKRAAAAGARPHQFLMVQAWVFGPSVTLYSVGTGSFRVVPGSLWGSLAGVFALVGFYNFAHSLRSGAVSINAPVFRLSFVLTAALAILVLGEPLTGYKVGGIALALAAAWLLLGGSVDLSHIEKQAMRSSLIRVLIATAAIGVCNFIYGLGLRAGATPASLIIAQAAVVMSLATIMVRVLDGRIRASAEVVRFAPQAAFALGLASVFMVEAIARGQASIAVPIAQMGFVVTALLGFAFLRERFTARKGVGIAAALIALSLLALPARAASCLDEAKDREAFNQCAQREILPLEARVVQLENTLRSRYRGDPKVLERFERSQESWNADRNSHGTIEAAARGGSSEMSVQRAFGACAKRTLELRVKELESVASPSVESR